MTIDDLENKYSIKFPEIYKRLFEDGMLFQENNIPNSQKLRDNPTLLCNATDFEQITFSQIDEQLETKPDYWKDDLVIIPFGQTGGGEWYAFFYDLKENDNIPIILLERAMNGIVLAKNLEDFIFRIILETACTNFYIEEKVENEIVFRNNMIRMIQSHRKYLSAEQNLIIDDTFNKPMIYENKNKVGMISEEELNNYLKEVIDFENLNLEFEYYED